MGRARTGTRPTAPRDRAGRAPGCHSRKFFQRRAARRWAVVSWIERMTENPTARIGLSNRRTRSGRNIPVLETLETRDDVGPAGPRCGRHLCETPVPWHLWHRTILSPFLRVPFPSQFLHFGFFSLGVLGMGSSDWTMKASSREARADHIRRAGPMVNARWLADILDRETLFPGFNACHLASYDHPHERKPARPPVQRPAESV